MATIIKGLLAQDLPWGLVFCGMAIALVVQMCGVRALSFAVGLYLPLSTTLPIFIGGMLRAWVDRKNKHNSEAEAELSPGMLYATGLVAGGALMGVLIAALQGTPKTVTAADGTTTDISFADWVLDGVGIRGFEHYGSMADLIGMLAFGVLCFFLWRVARKPAVAG
jgi:hypothetical protein